MGLIFTKGQRSCGKVMFSVVSVCHSEHSVEWASHVNINDDALDLTTQGPPPSSGYDISLSPPHTRPQCPGTLPSPSPPHTWDLATQGPPPSSGYDISLYKHSPWSQSPHTHGISLHRDLHRQLDMISHCPGILPSPSPPQHMGSHYTGTSTVIQI